MDSSPRQLPFPGTFQFRDDETAGIEALFERTFLDCAIEPAAQACLERTRFLPRPEGAADRQEDASGGAPQADVAAAADPVGGGAASVEADVSRYVVLWRGDSGIGKTRISQQVRASAASRNVAVYEVYHHDVEGIPFKPFLKAIRNILRDHDGGATLQEKYRYGLERLMPDLYGPGGASAGEEGSSIPFADDDSWSLPDQLSWSQADKIRTLDAITQLLLELTTQRPLLLLVHDLHWSDRPTIELLRYIGRNLALRNASRAPDPSRPEGAEAPFREETGAGPEFDGFEGDEWRGLAPKGLQPLDLATSFPSTSRIRAERLLREARAGSEAASAAGPRLMILANYRGFADSTFYLEQAIRELGSEPFSYHGEIHPLTAEEAGASLESSLEAIEDSGGRHRISQDGLEAIAELSEGYPGFLNQLLTAIVLGEGPFGEVDSESHVWTGDGIRAVLAGMETPLSPPTEPAASPPPNLEGQAEAESPPASRYADAPPRDPFTTGRRHSILRLRLSKTSPDELRILQALAVSRRPVTPTVLLQLLPGLSSTAEEPLPRIVEVLKSLETRGLLEHYDSRDREAGEGAAFYFFPLWDIVHVVEETLGDQELTRLHGRIGESCRHRLEDQGDLVAYELYYHLRRSDDPRASLQFGLMAARRFLHSFALEKARRIYLSLLGLLVEPEDMALRVDVLEQSAAISLALGEPGQAEEALRQAQLESGDSVPTERRLGLLLLEAEAACQTDPAKGLKIVGKATRLVSDENTLQGVRLQLVTARIRLARQDLKRAINFALKGVGACQKVGEIPELGELYRVLAGAFYRKGEYSYAVDHYQRALDIFERLEQRQALVRALDELGRVYLERGNHFRAARYLYKSLEVRRSEHDIVGLCKSYDELGQVYLRSGDYLKTIESLNRSLSLKERVGDFRGINPTLLVLGDLYFRLGRYEHALVYFNREVENSQRIGDTSGLVQAFTQLGRVFYQLGDVKRAESLWKQVSILASEFKLKSQEADGWLLGGDLRALARDWPEAEKCYKSAAETHGKLGHRRREVCALLNLSELKFNRELHDEALKFASKAQIIADEVKALDFQVRSLTLKGNIHRFLKGGNKDKSREFLQKALEFSQSLSDVDALFQLYYSLARVYHADREYAEASNFYGKAELVLKQIGEGLSDDHAVRFLEDSRRKVFREDISRFRREAMGRSPGALLDLRQSGVTVTAIKERPVTPADYKELTAKVLRVHSEINKLHFHDRVLAEALELTGADRGFVLRVQNRSYFPVAYQGFGTNPLQDPEFVVASNLTQESIRKGRSYLSSPKETQESGEEGSPSDKLQVAGLVHRSILSVPFMTHERIFGGVYLDKPLAAGCFVLKDRVLLEAFAEHAAVALDNRREFETAIRDPLTGYYTASYFTERLREAYRLFNLHGKSFTLIGYYLPTLEEALGDGRGQPVSTLTDVLQEVLPQDASLCWGSPILYILLRETDSPVAVTLARKVHARLEESMNEEIPMKVLPVHNRYHQGSDMYFEMRGSLLPETCDPRLLGELRAVLADDTSLREAKRILEKHKIESTLRKTGGNITHAARELGIHRPQLSNLLKKYSLRREVFENGGEEPRDTAAT